MLCRRGLSRTGPAVLGRTPQATSAGLRPSGMGPAAFGRVPAYGTGTRLSFTSPFHAPTRTFSHRRCCDRGSVFRTYALAPPAGPVPPVWHFTANCRVTDSQTRAFSFNCWANSGLNVLHHRRITSDSAAIFLSRSDALDVPEGQAVPVVHSYRLADNVRRNAMPQIVSKQVYISPLRSTESQPRDTSTWGLMGLQFPEGVLIGFR